MERRWSVCIRTLVIACVCYSCQPSYGLGSLVRPGPKFRPIACCQARPRDCLRLVGTSGRNPTSSQWVTRSCNICLHCRPPPRKPKVNCSSSGHRPPPPPPHFCIRALRKTSFSLTYRRTTEGPTSSLGAGFPIAHSQGVQPRLRIRLRMRLRGTSVTHQCTWVVSGAECHRPSPGRSPVRGWQGHPNRHPIDKSNGPKEQCQTVCQTVLPGRPNQGPTQARRFSGWAAAISTRTAFDLLCDAVCVATSERDDKYATYPWLGLKGVT